MYKMLILTVLVLISCAAQKSEAPSSIIYVDPITIASERPMVAEERKLDTLESIADFQEPIREIVMPEEEFTIRPLDYVHDEVALYSEDVQMTTPAAPTAATNYIKTGNPYVIKGVTYYPLQSVPDNYEEIGIASWYGSDFHGNKTSNGEVYDMYALSAAHKTLPMPVYAQVTNLDNNKTVVVRINDRGPFSKGRIIDLSFAAAKEIDMLATGTARVKITVLSESTTALKTDGITENIASGNFAIQIGAFANKENAEQLAASFNGGMVSATDVNGKTFYRVQITGYDTLQKAEAAATSLSAKHPGAFVIRR